MRNPLRTEAEAFSFVLAAALCFLAVGIAAALGGAPAALAAVLSLGLGAGVGIYLTSDPREREPAVWARRPPDERRRVLVLANETLPDRSLRDEIQNRAGPGSAEVLLVAPALDSSALHWSADEDTRRAEAVGPARRSRCLPHLGRCRCPRRGRGRRPAEGDRAGASYLCRGRGPDRDGAPRHVEPASAGRRREARASVFRFPLLTPPSTRSVERAGSRSPVPSSLRST